MSAKLNWGERDLPRHAGVLALYRECLKLRATHPIFQSAPRSAWEVAKLGSSGIAIMWHEAAQDWILLVSIKGGISLRPSDGRAWERVLSTNEQRFSGGNVLAETSPGAALWRSL